MLSSFSAGPSRGLGHFGFRPARSRPRSPAGRAGVRDGETIDGGGMRGGGLRRGGAVAGTRCPDGPGPARPASSGACGGGRGACRQGRGRRGGRVDGGDGGGHRRRDGARRAGRRRRAGAHLRGRRRRAGARDPASGRMSFDYRCGSTTRTRISPGSSTTPPTSAILERGRSEFLRVDGTGLPAGSDHGVFAVTRIAVDYRAPAVSTTLCWCRRGSGNARTSPEFRATYVSVPASYWPKRRSLQWRFTYDGRVRRPSAAEILHGGGL